MISVLLLEDDAGDMARAIAAIEQTAERYGVGVELTTTRRVVWPALDEDGAELRLCPDVVVLDVRDQGEERGYGVYDALRRTEASADRGQPPSPAYVILWSSAPAEERFDEFRRSHDGDPRLLVCELKSSKALRAMLAICLERMAEDFRLSPVAPVPR